MRRTNQWLFPGLSYDQQSQCGIPYKTKVNMSAAQRHLIDGVRGRLMLDLEVLAEG